MNTEPGVAALRLTKNTSLPKLFVLAQLEGLQKSKIKLPTLYATSGIIFPPRLNIEQSSSEITASYKAQIMVRKVVIDLTGGFGIDCFFFAKYYNRIIYIERNAELVDIVRWDFEKLGVSNVEFINGDGIQYLRNNSMVFDPENSLIYIDPARRDEHNHKVFQLSDCEPDVVENLSFLLEKANQILIKTSPMLDIGLAVKQLMFVAEIHVVAVENECKEVLYLIRKGFSGEPVIKTINFLGENIQRFDFTKTKEEESAVLYSKPLQYLYEPNVAVLKSGAFKKLAYDHNLHKLAPNTHLYTSNEPVKEFQGKVFEIRGVYKFKSVEIFDILADRKANIIARNFPYSVEEIKKNMKIKDGGEWFLFATKDMEDKLIIILALRLYTNHT